MEIYRYETPIETIKNLQKDARRSIFLAGPTPRPEQSHIVSWRKEAIEEFEGQGFNGILIIPEFENKGEYSKELSIWEFEGLKNCDVIMFWIPRTKELIGLTTNQEFGYWMARDRDKIVYGRPDDAYRIEYQDIMWEEDGREQNKRTYGRDQQRRISIYNTLETTIRASLNKYY